MKQQFTLTIISYVGGFLFSLLSAIRYYVIYTDLDRAVVYTLIGIIIMALGFLYQKVRKLEIDEQQVEEYLAEKSEVKE